MFEDIDSSQSITLLYILVCIGKNVLNEIVTDRFFLKNYEAHSVMLNRLCSDLYDPTT